MIKHKALQLSSILLLAMLVWSCSSSSAADGNFRLVWDDPPTMDPALVADGVSARLVVEVFSGLVSPGTGDQLVVSELAESWTQNEEGTIYEFVLREDARFHDGTQVTAGDVKFSLERALSPDTSSPTASIFLGDILGAQSYMDGESSEVAGVTVLDQRRLSIELDAPRPYFLAKLTNPVAFVVDEGNVAEGDGWTRQPNGTGPFVLEEWVEGERMVLSANDEFYKGGPELEQATFILSGGSQLAMYEAGQIDFMALSSQDVQVVSDPGSDLADQVVRARPDFSLTYIAFNNDMAPFDDPMVRRAFNHGVDKEAIADAVGQRTRVPAYGLLPPGFPGYDSSFEGLRYDPELARQLLDESSYGDNPAAFPRVTITYPGGFGPNVNRELEAMVDMWQEVLGVQVDLQQMEFGTFLEQMFQGQLQAFNLQWVPDYADPHAILDILFHSQSSNNVNGYENPQVDQLLEGARASTDQEERIDMYRSVEEMVVEDATWLPLWFSGDKLYLAKPHVEGLNLSPLVKSRLSSVYLEDE